MTFNIYCAERTRRTQVFARTATYAAFLVHHRNFNRSLIVGIGSYHCYCAGGTMARTVAAFHSVCERYAIFLNPHGMTYLS